MKKMTLLVMIPFMACATAKEAAPPQKEIVEKPVLVEIAPLKLQDCEELVKNFTTDELKERAMDNCQAANEREELRYRAEKAEAEAKVLKAQAAKPQATAVRRGSGGGGGGSMPTTASAHPGGSVDGYRTASAFDGPADATKCGLSANRSLTIRNIAEGDVTGRANRVVVYVPSRGKFVSTKGCFFTPPQATVLADLDGNNRFDAPYGAGNLFGDLHVPADDAILYFLDCDERSVCTTVTVHRYWRHGGRSWVSARGGNVLKYTKNRS